MVNGSIGINHGKTFPSALQLAHFDAMWELVRRTLWSFSQNGKWGSESAKKWRVVGVIWCGKNRYFLQFCQQKRRIMENSKIHIDRAFGGL